MAETPSPLAISHVPALVVGGVGLLAVTEAAQVYLGMGLLGQPVPWLTALRLTGPSWGILLLLVTPLIRWLNRATLGAPSRGPAALAHAGVGTGFVILHLAGTAFAEELLSPEPVGLRVRLLHLASAYFVVDGFTYAAIVATHAVIVRRGEAIRRDLVTVHERVARSEHRRRSLEGRLRPDFFFNTLNAVSGLVVRGERAAAIATLDAFGALMRASLGNADVAGSVREELALVEHYGIIQSMRYPDRVRVSCAIADGAGGRSVSPLRVVGAVERVVSSALESGGTVDLSVLARSVGAAVEVTFVLEAQGVPNSVLELAVEEDVDASWGGLPNLILRVDRSPAIVR